MDQYQILSFYNCLSDMTHNLLSIRKNVKIKFEAIRSDISMSETVYLRPKFDKHIEKQCSHCLTLITHISYTADTNEN